MMQTPALLIILLTLLISACTPATEPLTAAPGLQQVRVVTAFDGDSGIAADENGQFEFRLYGIDAPERDDVSQAALVALIAGFGSDLYAEERDVDRYARRVVVFQTRTAHAQ